MASERADALADDFTAANEEAVAFARACSEHDWSVRVPGEEWTVGVVLHHVAEGHALGARWIRGMACGDGVPETAQEVDRANAGHAVRASRVGATETIALLEEEGARFESVLRALSDNELDRVAPFGPAGGKSFATAELAPVLARHARDHVAHARAAVAGGG